MSAQRENRAKEAKKNDTVVVMVVVGCD